LPRPSEACLRAARNSGRRRSGSIGNANFGKGGRLTSVLGAAGRNATSNACPAIASNRRSRSPAATLATSSFHCGGASSAARPPVIQQSRIIERPERSGSFI
jgi:hypothetical protein